jgi:hypothetical protein
VLNQGGWSAAAAAAAAAGRAAGGGSNAIVPCVTLRRPTQQQGVIYCERNCRAVLLAAV